MLQSGGGIQGWVVGNEEGMCKVLVAGNSRRRPYR